MGRIPSFLSLSQFSQKLLAAAPTFSQSHGGASALRRTPPPPGSSLPQRGRAWGWDRETSAFPRGSSRPFGRARACLLGPSEAGSRLEEPLEHRGQLSPSGVKKSNRNRSGSGCVPCRKQRKPFHKTV